MVQPVAVHILLVASVIVLCAVVRFALQRVHVPAIVGYFAIGIALRLVDDAWGIMGPGGHRIFTFLAEMGVVVLLFRVGLESKVERLLRRLRTASVIFVGDVVVSGAVGFFAARYLVGWGLIPSLFVSVALTATSVGISVSIWQDAGRLTTSAGEIMLDVAELDDLSGVLLMALLLAMAPALRGTLGHEFVPMLGALFGTFLVKLIALGLFCVLFSRYAERHVTETFQRIHSGSGALLMVLGIGIIVAAGAELLGFSVAIGAFFAGLMFSRDPTSVKLDVSFASLHDLFAPFFFVGIGLELHPSALSAGFVPIAVLLVAAAVGKLLGNGGTTWMTSGRTAALLIGVSMLPRAEIALIVMQRGLDLGDWAVPSEAYAAMVAISAILALAVPIVLRRIFERHPTRQEAA